MARALGDEIARIRAEVARHRVGLVIVDSFAPACGAEPEGSDAAIRLMNALRSLAPATRLLLAHVSKAGRGRQDRPDGAPSSEPPAQAQGAHAAA